MAKTQEEDDFNSARATHKPGWISLWKPEWSAGRGGFAVSTPPLQSASPSK